MKVTITRLDETTKRVIVARMTNTHSKAAFTREQIDLVEDINDWLNFLLLTPDAPAQALQVVNCQYAVKADTREASILEVQRLARVLGVEPKLAGGGEQYMAERIFGPHGLVRHVFIYFASKHGAGRPITAEEAAAVAKEALAAAHEEKRAAAAEDAEREQYPLVDETTQEGLAVHDGQLDTRTRQMLRYWPVRQPLDLYQVLGEPVHDSEDCTSVDDVLAGLAVAGEAIVPTHKHTKACVQPPMTPEEADRFAQLRAALYGNPEQAFHHVEHSRFLLGLLDKAHGQLEQLGLEYGDMVEAGIKDTTKINVLRQQLYSHWETQVRLSRGLRDEEDNRRELASERDELAREVAALRGQLQRSEQTLDVVTTARDQWVQKFDRLAHENGGLELQIKQLEAIVEKHQTECPVPQ